MLLNGRSLFVAMISISKKNEVYLKIEAEPHVFYELSDEFTFDVPGAKFMPQYRNKYWDGKIRLFNTQTGEIYVGLLDKLVAFCRRYDYEYQFVDKEDNLVKRGIIDLLIELEDYFVIIDYKLSRTIKEEYKTLSLDLTKFKIQRIKGEYQSVEQQIKDQQDVKRGLEAEVAKGTGSWTWNQNRRRAAKQKLQTEKQTSTP